MSALVEVSDICKVYNPGENEVRALDHVSLTINKGEFVAIIGQSGCPDLREILPERKGCFQAYG